MPSDEDNSIMKKFKLSDLVSIIRHRFEEIIEEAEKVIERSGYSDLAKRNIVLTGGTSELRGSIEIAKRILDTNIRLGIPIKIGGLSEDIGGPSFAACSGVLMHCLKQSKKEHETIKNNRSSINKFFKNIMGADF